MIMPANAATDTAGFDRAIEITPATGQRYRCRRRQPKPAQQTFARRIVKVFIGRARMQHGVVIDDLQIAWCQMHGEHDLRALQNFIKQMTCFLLLRAQLRHPVERLCRAHPVTIPFAKNSAVAFRK